MMKPVVRRFKVIPQQKKTQKSKYFKLIEYFYKFLHIVCCLDFGFFDSKSYKRRILWKSLTVFQFTTWCVLSCILLDLRVFGNLFLIFYFLLLFSYFVNVLGLVLISYNKTLYSVFKDLENIDFELQKVGFYNYLEIKIIVANCLHIGTRIIVFIFTYCVIHDMCSPISFILNFLILNMHSVLVSYALVFFLINCRLKELVSILRRTNSDFSNLQGIYRMIVELVEVQKSSFDPLFVIALIYNVPEAMSSVYFAIYVAEHSQNTYKLVLNNVAVLEALLILFSPALCAGMLASQTEEIIIILHDKLLLIKDKPLSQEINRFINYIEERDCSLRVYGLIPLDAKLLGTVLNFCVTYLIVLIQFSDKSS